MDLLQEGKRLAQQNEYEEALDAFLLALENDRENADIHFYLGLCYSSLEHFRFARYHYDIAINIAPNHEKTKLVLGSLQDVVPEKPPERKLTRAAIAKTRRKKDSSSTSDQASKTFVGGEMSSKLKLTEDKWERAFPSDAMTGKQGNKDFLKLIVPSLIAILLVAAMVYYLLSFFY